MSATDPTDHSGGAASGPASQRPLLRRPLAGAAVVFAAGAAWGAGRTACAAAPLWIAAGLCAAAWAFLRFLLPRRFRSAPAAAALSAAAVFGLAFCGAALHARSRACARMETVERLRDELDGGDAAFRGRVATPPSVVPLPHGGARMRFDLAVAEIAREPESVALPGPPFRIRVDWFGPRSMGAARPPFPVPRAGEGWAVEGLLREVPSRSAVPLLVLSLRHGEGGARRAPAFDAPPAALALRDVREAASRALGLGVAPDSTGLALVRAMVLGERGEVPPDAERAFKDSGTVHVFAISGLHVGVVAAFLFLLLRTLRLPDFLQALAFAAALVLYVALSGGRPSAVRACAMALAAAAAPFLHRKADGVLALAATAVALLCFDPLQVYDLGFVFSFLCTAGILLLLGPLRSDAVARLRPTRAGLWFGRRGPRTRHALAWLAGGFAVSAAAWLASAPLTAACFGRFSPLSILVNVPVVPLATVSVGLAAASLCCAPFAPALCVPLNRLAASAADAMAAVAHAAAEAPGVAARTDPWPPAAVAAWYLALLALCVWFRRRSA